MLLREVWLYYFLILFFICLIYWLIDDGRLKFLWLLFYIIIINYEKMVISLVLFFC